MNAPRNGQSAWEAELFRLLVDNSTDYAVFVVGLDGRVLTWNPGAERVLGYRESEIVGKSSVILFTPEDQAAGIPEAELGIAIAEGRASDDRWHLRKDGSRLWVSGVMTLLREDTGWPLACAKVMRDFTKGKLAADALHKNKNQLQITLKTTKIKT